MNGLRISARIFIPESELGFTYARSSGPGGQHVNTSATKAVLRWNPGASGALPETVRSRVLARLGGRLTGEGDLVLQSDRFRSRERNRADCLERLRELVGRAMIPPKPRKKTKPTRASKRRREETKRKRSETKRSRGKVRY